MSESRSTEKTKLTTTSLVDTHPNLTKVNLELSRNEIPVRYTKNGELGPEGTTFTSNSLE